MRVYWLRQALADVPAHDDWLSAGESARLSTLLVPKRRADWRLGRWTAKRAVATYLEMQPSLLPPSSAANVRYEGIELRPEPSGAPEVFVFGKAAPLTISLTHSTGSAVCAVAASGMLLGCDLEFVEPRAEVFPADYFTAEEQAFVARWPSAVRDRIITLLWTGKESALKALRTGLRLDTRDLVVTPEFEGSDDWRRVTVRCAACSQCFQGWWRDHDNFVLTLVGAPAPAMPILLQPGHSSLLALVPGDAVPIECTAVGIPHRRIAQFAHLGDRRLR